jgi:NAD(P)-dependent dehydrogenase (short-subunit alcohol dehydrogenase family)
MARTVIVTGATDGIGRQTAIELARRGADVVVHGRDPARVRAVTKELGERAAPPLIADLAELAQARKLADELLARGVPLFAIVHNAGVYMRKRSETADGREMTMAVNHDAPVLLTHLLLDALRAGDEGRVVCVSSIAHSRGDIDVDDIDMRTGWDPYGAYAASKLANVLFAVELARRLAGSSVTANALHPGVVSTKLLKTGFGMQGPDSLAEGAATSVFLALSDDVRGVSGKYFVRSRPATPSAAARDDDLCRRFYEASCARVSVTPLPRAG